MPILEIKNLSKHFDGIKAVNNLSIKVEGGTITGIIGPNGSGKSTLMNLLSGFYQFDKGVVIISKSLEFKKIKPEDVSFFGVTRTFQEVRLFNQMSVLDNILIALTERRIWASLFEKHKDYHLKKAQETLSKVNLWEKRDEQALNLSYGQRKLLEIARILAMASGGSPYTNAQIFLLDEPFTGLFPQMAKIVELLIKELKKQGKTVILIEHNMQLIRELCDYIFVLDSGELLAEGKPKQVLEKREVIEAYLGE